MSKTRHIFEVERVVAGGVPVSMHKTAHRRSFPVHSTASAGDAGRAVSARVASGSPAASMVRRRRQQRAVPLCERGARSEHVCAAHWHLQGALAGQVIHALAMGGVSTRRRRAGLWQGMTHGPPVEQSEPRRS